MAFWIPLIQGLMSASQSGDSSQIANTFMGMARNSARAEKAAKKLETTPENQGL